MVDGGFFLVMVSVRVGPRSENGCVSKNFHINTGSGNPAICQPVAMRLAYDIFDTFRYCILESSQAVMTVCRVELLCD